MSWTITPDQLRTIVDDAAADGVFVLDVRDAEELADGQIEGSHRIALSELGERITELPRKKKIAVYCAHGIRSLEATYLLRARGFTDVVSLEGGLAAWAELKASSN